MTHADSSARRDEAVRKALKLMRRQAELYERLEGLADRQRSLVAEDDVGPLLRVLSRRRELVGELSTVHAALEPVRRAWPDFREALNGAEREEAERLLGDAATRLKRVLDGDERDVHLLTVRRQVTGDAVRATGAVGGALQAYRGGASVRAAVEILDEAS